MLQVCPGEIEDMISIVDKNGDGDSLSLTFLFSMRKGRVKKTRKFAVRLLSGLTPTRLANCEIF